jgi:hypothetical protein
MLAFLAPNMAKVMRLQLLVQYVLELFIRLFYPASLKVLVFFELVCCIDLDAIQKFKIQK